MAVLDHLLDGLFSLLDVGVVLDHGVAVHRPALIKIKIYILIRKHAHI
jgi:hypothetical protein